MNNDFKHFVKGIIIVGLLGVLGLSIAYIGSESLAPVYPDARSRSALFAEVADSVIAASFGNSHNKAIVFHVLDLKGFHLWWSGGDVFEARRAIEETIKRSPNLKYAFVTVSAYAIDNSVLKNVDAGRSDLRRKTYFEFKNYYPLTSDWENAFLAVLAPIVRPDNWREVFMKVLFGQENEDTVAPNGFPGGRSNNNLTAQQAYQSAQARSKRHLSLEEESLEQKKNLCEDIKHEFKKIAAIAEKSSVSVIFYTPPYTQAYRSFMEQNSNKCQLDKIATNITSEWHNSWYLDYSSDSLSGNLSFFEDSDHLSEKGARIFSSRLYTDLKKIGLLN